jgi:hypothetical protein
MHDHAGRALDLRLDDDAAEFLRMPFEKIRECGDSLFGAPCIRPAIRKG